MSKKNNQEHIEIFFRIFMNNFGQAGGVNSKKIARTCRNGGAHSKKIQKNEIQQRTKGPGPNPNRLGS
jgi:hypothetical protein